VQTPSRAEQNPFHSHISDAAQSASDAATQVAFGPGEQAPAYLQRCDARQSASEVALHRPPSSVHAPSTRHASSHSGASDDGTTHRSS
jgi:hypothetical protein